MAMPCRRVVAQQNESCQTDGRRGVSSGGFGNDLLRAQAWNLANNLAAQVFVGDDPAVTGRSQWQKAGDRLLDHGLLAVKRQQLFGPPLAAQRPEAGAAAAGENHGIEIGSGLLHKFR